MEPGSYLVFFLSFLFIVGSLCLVFDKEHKKINNNISKDIYDLSDGFIIMEDNYDLQ